MKSRYRTKIAPSKQTDFVLGDPFPRFFYAITDGLNGPIIKQGSSRSSKGWMGAWYAAEKTIKRLMLKEQGPVELIGADHHREGKATNERIHFRLIHMECCGQLLCWVNPRFPTHCPECGRLIYPQVKGWVIIRDSNAHLRYRTT